MLGRLATIQNINQVWKEKAHLEICGGSWQAGKYVGWAAHSWGWAAGCRVSSSTWMPTLVFVLTLTRLYTRPQRAAGRHWGRLEESTLSSEVMVAIGCTLPEMLMICDTYFPNFKAHIPLETGFALATQHKWNQHKKHEMYMADARILRWDPTQPLFHWLAFGFRVG